MILKDKNSQVPADRFGKAGYEAEMQMAFYLRRAFGDTSDIYVFNDLRLERHGEFAQIDHLVLHRFGLVIIESKSVVGQLTVNSRGEFARIWDGRPRGIQSPIQQARLQQSLLGQLLNDHKEQLRRKVMFGLRQGAFGEDRFKVLVAVSDTGVIQRHNCDPEELCKAEVVAERVKEIVRRHDHASGAMGLLRAAMADTKTAQQMDRDQLIELTAEEMSGIARFLIERHTPLTVEVIPPPPLKSDALRIRPKTMSDNNKQATSRLICRHCQLDAVTVLHGRYGYFGKCTGCNGNTPVDTKCQACGEKARIQKSGLVFSRACECGVIVQVHANVPPE